MDLGGLDLLRVAHGPDEIRAANPQRGSMEHLDAIVAVDLTGNWAVGRKEVRSDEFWVEGHIPGRPLLPGVVMIEAAAQLCSFLMKKIRPELRDRFIGFAGVEGVRFRATVSPGARLILVSKLRRLGRLGEFDTQGVVEGRVVFEGRILGIPV